MFTFTRLMMASAIVLGVSTYAHAQAATHRVAVVPLQNLRNDATMDWVGSGTSETLTTKLAAVKGLVMIEKTQISRILREQDIKISQTDDVNVASKLGKLISAERLVLGSFAKAGGDILFNVRVVDVDTGVVLNTASVKTSEAKIFDAMFELAEAVILSFDKKVVVVDKTPTAGDAPKSERIELTENQRAILKEAGTGSFEAMETWCKAFDLETTNPKESLRLANKAIELDANFAFAHATAGNAYILLNQHERAIAEFTKAIRLLPAEYLYYCQRGMAYASMRDFDKAMADLNKALEMNDQAPIAYSRRALALAQQGLIKEALADTERAIVLDPSQPGNFAFRAQILALNGQLDKAMADATHAIKMAPTASRGYFARAFINKRMKKYADAVTDYTKVIELDPLVAEGYCNRANSLYMLDEYDRAVADYSKAIELYGDYFEAWRGRGLSYYNQEDFAKALADFTKAIAINGQDGELFNYRTKTYVQLRNYAKAWDDLRKAEKLGVEFDAKYKDALRTMMEREK